MTVPTAATGFSNPINFSAGTAKDESTVRGPLSCSITVSQKNKCVTATAILASDKTAAVQMSVVTRAARTKISYAQSNLSEENLEILMDQVSKAYVKFMKWFNKLV